MASNGIEQCSYWAESEPITQPASGKSRRSPVRLRAGVSLLQVRARKHYILHFPSNFVEHLLRMGQSTSRVKRNHYLSWNPLASLDFCHSTSVTTARRSELAYGREGHKSSPTMPWICRAMKKKRRLRRDTLLEMLSNKAKAFIYSPS
ncbi:hypothetical protein GW17_00053082 [Ensete ventricosum]|nr:hypothetical protein GW17_00053082 [Ensete ventricosum]